MVDAVLDQRLESCEFLCVSKNFQYLFEKDELSSIFTCYCDRICEILRVKME